jgi:hypothetical protein
MQTIIYKLFFIFFAFCICEFTYAQAKGGSSYTYDDNGNRIATSVIYLQTSLKSAQMPLDEIIVNDSLFAMNNDNVPQDGWGKGATEPLNAFGVTVYPNPTSGKLIIEITGISPTTLTKTNNSIRIWSMQGLLIFDNKTVCQFNFIDLSDQPNGSYLLKLQVENNTKDYTIIKD